MFNPIWQAVNVLIRLDAHDPNNRFAFVSSNIEMICVKSAEIFGFYFAHLYHRALLVNDFAYHFTVGRVADFIRVEALILVVARQIPIALLTDHPFNH